MEKQHGKNNVFFILGEPARLSSRRFQASQTHIHGSTLRNVVSSRRAVGLFAPMFSPFRETRSVGRNLRLARARTIVKRTSVLRNDENISASIPLACPSATSPRFAANHPIPSPVPFSRAANSASGPSLEIMGTSPASGYRHATADAVGRGFEFFWPCGSESL